MQLEFDVTVKMNGVQVANKIVIMTRNSIKHSIVLNDDGITLKQGKIYDVHVSCILHRPDVGFLNPSNDGM